MNSNRYSQLCILLSRIEDTDNPDLNLDADIAEACGFIVDREHYHRYTQEWSPTIQNWQGCNKHPLPTFTDSMDAVLILIDHTLPELLIRVSNEYMGFWRATVGLSQGKGKRTAPLALLCALLRALIAMESARDV